MELTQDTAKDLGSQPSPTATVVRTESHAARFNNARALFEKLGEGRVNRPPPFSIKMSHSSSKEDNLSEVGSEQDRSPSPKRKHHPITNGIGKLDSNRILNQSRLKAEKPEKPEKPERKFNSRELIEKQKNWTSHFSKTRTTKGSSDFNRCDIIRTVPGTGIISASAAPANSCSSTPTSISTNGNSSVQSSKDSGSQRTEVQYAPAAAPHRLQSPSEPPPSPPKRQTPPPPPPEKGPRSIRQSSFPSPTKIPPAVPPHATDPGSLSPTKISPEKLKSPPRQAEPPPPVVATALPPAAPIRNKADEPPEKGVRKKSLETTLDEQTTKSFRYPELGALRRQSTEKDSGTSGLTSPAHAISSSPSPGASVSSGPSSPIHTEDEKQENEPTEKADCGKLDEDEGVAAEEKSGKCPATRHQR